MKKRCRCGQTYNVDNWQLKSGRGKYCSRECMYKYRTRPSGLRYSIKVINKSWLQKGNTPWNKGLAGLGICKATSGSIQKGEHRSAMTEFKRGTPEYEHVSWRGNDVGYHGLHIWVRKHKGKAIICQNCGKSHDRIHWANISNEYKRDLDDWMQLCPSCHMQYDNNKLSLMEIQKCESAS